MLGRSQPTVQGKALPASSGSKICCANQTEAVVRLDEVHFGRTYCHRLHGQRNIKQRARSKQQAEAEIYRLHIQGRIYVKPIMSKLAYC